MTELPLISVCICTYKRPDLLKRLLEELARQKTGGLFRYAIVVADNDQAESAKSVVQEFRGRSAINIVYCVEPRQNIALVRNRALANATGDLVAFIDDDEFPIEEWLLTMFQAITKSNVDGVLGPVEPHFERKPPNWIIRGKFYHRPRHQTGFIIPWTEGRTGNLLFKRQVVEKMDKPFREEFGSGGEDRNFFMRLMRQGRVFIWCDEAVAYELIPEVRCRRAFMLRRALLRGKAYLSRPNARRIGVPKSLIALVLYSLALPFLLVSGQHHFMKYLIKICDHAGRILAFIGCNPIQTSYVTE